MHICFIHCWHIIMVKLSERAVQNLDYSMVWDVSANKPFIDRNRDDFAEAKCTRISWRHFSAGIKSVPEAEDAVQTCLEAINFRLCYFGISSSLQKRCHGFGDGSHFCRWKQISPICCGPTSAMAALEMMLIQQQLIFLMIKIMP